MGGFFLGMWCYRIQGRKEGNVLFNKGLNTFCVLFYDIRHNNGKGPLRLWTIPDWVLQEELIIWPIAPWADGVAK